MGLKYGFECSCGSGEEDEYTVNGPGTCPNECSGGDSYNCGKPSPSMPPTNCPLNHVVPVVPVVPFVLEEYFVSSVRTSTPQPRWLLSSTYCATCAFSASDCTPSCLVFLLPSARLLPTKQQVGPTPSLCTL